MFENCVNLYGATQSPETLGVAGPWRLASRLEARSDITH
jgi:hypothetical protein